VVMDNAAVDEVYAWELQDNVTSSDEDPWVSPLCDPCKALLEDSSMYWKKQEIKGLPSHRRGCEYNQPTRKQDLLKFTSSGRISRVPSLLSHQQTHAKVVA